jgi:hypothetical protein
MRINLTAAVVAVGLCLLIAGVAQAAVTNVYWRVDLHQGSYIIAHGQGTTEQAAWDDCFRLQTTTRALTASETRRTSGVVAVTSSVVRWCQTPKRYATIAPDVAPTPVNCVVSAWSTWTDPAWSACTAGEQTRTLTRTRTIVTQPANGGTACPALTESTTERRECSASLSWTPPTQNTDGSALTNLAGYRIAYGTSSTALTQTIQIANPGLSSYTVNNLAPGTYYFAVRAYSSAGSESVSSNIASKVVQ